MLVGVLVAASAAARPGKVVRVEQRARTQSGVPRMCLLSGSDLTGYCMSSTPPEVGNRMQIVDNERVLGTMRVRTVTEQPDQCGQQTVWMVQGTLDSGDLSKADGGMIGVLDVTLDQRSGKLVSIDHPATGHAAGIDQVWAVDANGDGVPEVEFVMFACEDGGAVGPNPTGTCVETWEQNTAGRLERKHQDRFRNCF
jgi:hypothetical protein